MKEISDSKIKCNRCGKIKITHNDDDLKRITRLGTYFGTDYQGV